jgi:TRAP-type mannitol/chloroaromatic compound transport system permease small subunit
VRHEELSSTKARILPPRPLLCRSAASDCHGRDSRLIFDARRRATAWFAAPTIGRRSSSAHTPTPLGVALSLLLSLSRVIDRITERIGQGLYWLILVTVLISAANAVVRKAFNYSSNSYLEAQWYLFSAVFLGAAGYTLLRNEHVRIDVISGKLSPRARAWIDILGTLFFLLPMAVLIGWLGWPVFVDSYVRGEVSSNAGGLIIWPARLLVPVGFFLLAIQGVSELIKRVAFLMDLIPDPGEKHVVKTAEEQLAEDILRARGEESLAAEIAAKAPKPDGDNR